MNQTFSFPVTGNSLIVSLAEMKLYTSSNVLAFFFFSKFYLFIYFWLWWVFVDVFRFSLVAASGCCFLVVVHGLLIAVFPCWDAQALYMWASPVVVHGISCSMACGLFLDQGLNLHPLHWQLDSYPLHHLGSPSPCLLKQGWLKSLMRSRNVKM